MNKFKKSQFIKNTLKNLGFTHVGISKPEVLTKEKNYLNKWLNKGYNGTMGWIEKRQDERCDIFKYFPEVKSVISVGLNYFNGISERNLNKSGISNYAQGDDYHDVLKSKLYSSLKQINKKFLITNYRVCVDTSPVMDKVWAQKSGIGWIGKHTNLITKDFGSWIFLGELMLDIELEYDFNFDEDLCGTCTACIDACPTDAIFESYQLDSNRCISYQTIEYRGDFNDSVDLENWIYGCDICQEVCPWNNKFEQLTNESAFQPRKELINKNNQDWIKITPDKFSNLMKNSAIKRTKHSGFVRNVKQNIKLKMKNCSKNIIQDE